MTRDKLLEIARECARSKPESYYSEPFQPHEWVLDAMAKVAALARTAAEAAEPSVKVCDTPAEYWKALTEWMKLQPIAAPGVMKDVPDFDSLAAKPADALTNAAGQWELTGKSVVIAPDGSATKTESYKQDNISAAPTPERVREIAKECHGEVICTVEVIEKYINQALRESVAAPSGWVSVKERLPDEGTYLTWIVYGKEEGEGSCFPCALTNTTAGKYWTVMGDHEHVTHWQPLPEPPTGEKK